MSEEQKQIPNEWRIQECRDLTRRAIEALVTAREGGVADAAANLGELRAMLRDLEYSNNAAHGGGAAPPQ